MLICAAVLLDDALWYTPVYRLPGTANRMSRSADTCSQAKT